MTSTRGRYLPAECKVQHHMRRNQLRGQLREIARRLQTCRHRQTQLTSSGWFGEADDGEDRAAMNTNQIL